MSALHPQDHKKIMVWHGTRRYFVLSLEEWRRHRDSKNWFSDPRPDEEARYGTWPWGKQKDFPLAEKFEPGTDHYLYEALKMKPGEGGFEVSRDSRERRPTFIEMDVDEEEDGEEEEL